MISSAVVKELRRAIKRNRYEMSPEGIVVPDLGTVGGLFETALNGGAWEPGVNLVPTQGLNNCASAFLGGSAFNPEDAWYFAPFATNTAPVLTLTAANFNSTQTEFTNYSGARALWTPDPPGSGVIANVGTPVSITVGAATGTTNTSIYGLGLLSASAKGATTGILAACALLASPRLSLQEGDILGLRYSLTLANAA
jgi:hypothetical protein